MKKKAAVCHRQFIRLLHCWLTAVLLCHIYAPSANDKLNLCFRLPGKVVDLDPCLTKKPVEDSACHPYNTRGSMSEVHSLSSFQSESCDDNGMLPLSQLNLQYRTD